MTEFERIKAMDRVELALYINKLQKEAIDDYENGFFPKGAFEIIAMLEGEVPDTCITSETKPRVRMTIEFDIDQDALDEHGLSANDVFHHLTFEEDDVVDGFQVSTNLPGLDPVSNFFLCSGKVVSQELFLNRMKQVPILSDQIKTASTHAAGSHAHDRASTNQPTHER